MLFLSATRAPDSLRTPRMRATTLPDVLSGEQAGGTRAYPEDVSLVDRRTFVGRICVACGITALTCTLPTRAARSPGSTASEFSRSGLPRHTSLESSSPRCARLDTRGKRTLPSSDRLAPGDSRRLVFLAAELVASHVDLILSRRLESGDVYLLAGDFRDPNRHAFRRRPSRGGIGPVACSPWQQCHRHDGPRSGLLGKVPRVPSRYRS